MTVNALTTADAVIIPIDPELFAMTGMNDLMDSIGRVREGLNPHIQILGVLFVKCIMRTNLYKEAQKNIRSYFTNVPVLENVVPSTVKVGEANNHFMAIVESDWRVSAGHALFVIGSKRLHINFEIPAYKFEYMGKAGGR